jgi:nucleotide-binding universal stress UspA family protein
VEGILTSCDPFNLWRNIPVAEDGATVGQVIVSEAKDFDVDLIIKGAFTRSRLRQLVFGGPTSEIFNHATCPVILCH